MVIGKHKKRGWMKIVEAFVSILLVVGVLLIVINKGYIGRDVSLEVYQEELSILRGIEVDEQLRMNILISNKSGYNPPIDNSSLPIPWEQFDNNQQRVLEDVKNKIIQQVPTNLECKAMLCSLSDSCILEGNITKEIYSQAVTIVANYEIFSPRQLKLFCWRK